MQRIYFDNASTTPVYKAVFKAMRPYLTKYYGNPSSIHKEGKIAKKAIEEARIKIADLLNCYPEEIFFTSGASESNSWIAKNFNYEYSKYSHDSIKLAKRKKSKSAKILSIPWIDSELGILHNDVFDFDLLHIDLTQTIGKCQIRFYENDLKDNPIATKISGDDNFRLLDKCIMASFSGHKFGAPKGVGVLFIRKKYINKMKPLIYGHQENGLRGGTENVAGIVGMAKALELTYSNFNKNKIKIEKLKIKFDDLTNEIPLKMLKNNNIINITFNHLSAQSAVLIFDKYGVAISAGSACRSGTDEISESLLDFGYTEEEALRTIRISLGHQNTIFEVKKFVSILTKVIDKYDHI